MKEFIKKVRLFLGHPIISVELTDEQIEESYKDAKNSFVLFYEYSIDKSLKNKFKLIWIERYALENCKEILGTIRGKFKNGIDVGSEKIYLESYSLLKTSQENKKMLINLIREKI